MRSTKNARTEGMSRRAAALTCSTGLAVSLLLWGSSYLNVDVVLEPIHSVMMLTNGQLMWTYDRDLRFTVDLFGEDANPQLMQGVYFVDQSVAWAMEVTPERPWHVRGFSGWQTSWTPWLPCGYDVAFGIPLWMTSVLCGAGLWLTLRPARRRRRRETRGLCRDCGYDLRGTARRCPECGAEAAR